MRDERVAALLADWGNRSGTWAAVQQWIETVQEIAELTGFPTWQDVLSQTEFEVDDERSMDELERLAARAERIISELLPRLKPPFDLAGEAVTFVKQLGLPWPWLALELMSHYLERVSGSVSGVVFKHELSVVASDAPAPRVELHFVTEDGEMTGAAIQRLFSEVARVYDQLESARLPRGKMPNKTAEVLRRRTRWFYRHRVRRDGILTIARSEFEHEPQNRRREIQGGIAEIQRLLSLTRYSFDDS
jgi:hypothetical protein